MVIEETVIDFFIIILTTVVLLFAYKSKKCNRCKKFIWKFQIISVNYSKVTETLKCPKCNYEFEKEISHDMSNPTS